MTDYYFDPAGVSGNNGLSAATPKPDGAWASMTIGPGDRILLKGGATFVNNIWVGGGSTINGSDAATNPLRIDSYGTGRATIQEAAAGQAGILLYNAGASGVEIRNLILVGPGSTSTQGGVAFYADAVKTYQHVVIENVEASGFLDGILMGGGATNVILNDVQVRDCLLHDNKHGGLTTYGPTFVFATPKYFMTNLVVQRVVAYTNRGNTADTTNPSGNGITLGSVNGATVEYCRAYNNGDLCPANAGPVGIWCYDSNAVTIQKCISHNNRRGAANDGDGFDIDQNCSNCTIQYCLSYLNEGAGYLRFNGGTAQVAGNTIRFNVSIFDVNKASNLMGGLHIGGACSNDKLHNNTIISRDNGTIKPPCLEVFTGTFSGNSARNNVFVQMGTGPITKMDGARTVAEIQMQGNAYYAATPSYSRNSISYATIALLRAAMAGVEQVSGNNTEYEGNPQVTDAVTVPTLTDPLAIESFTQHKLLGPSPVAALAIDLAATFGGSNGVNDFHGQALRLPTSRGAHQAPVSGFVAY